MTKVDLIIGFLGSGKTTFLKKYIAYLLSLNERICVLEFDYGAINIDMMLLQEFNTKIDIEMVAGGCDYDCHLRRFRTKMIAMGMKKYDRVIIEPSGIFDTDEFFDTVYDEPLDNWYEIGSVVSVADVTRNLYDLSEDEKYILASQIGSSGTLILSKTQLTDTISRKKYLSELQKIMESLNMSLYSPKLKIMDKSFDNLTENDFEKIRNSSFFLQEHEKKDVISTNHFSSIYFMNKDFSIDELCDKIDSLFSGGFGKIIRVKGFCPDKNKWKEFNFTEKEKNISDIDNGQNVIIVIGENLHEEKITDLFTKK